MPLTTVLILEDDAALLRLFGRVLNAAGCDVYTATTLSAAGEQLSRQTFDIFICDMRIGSERGIDLLRRHITRLTASGTQTIVVSAEEQYRASCDELGVEFFLSKPVSPLALARLVERLSIKPHYSTAS